jgi:hypothetical protein
MCDIVTVIPPKGCIIKSKSKGDYVMKYVLGALIGGVVGYLVLYRLIGCSTGACPITANPYISVIYGIIMGLLVAGSA